MHNSESTPSANPIDSEAERVGPRPPQSPLDDLNGTLGETRPKAGDLTATVLATSSAQDTARARQSRNPRSTVLLDAMRFWALSRR